MVERRSSGRKRKAPERFAPGVDEAFHDLPEDFEPLARLEQPAHDLLNKRVTVSWQAVELQRQPGST